MLKSLHASERISCRVRNIYGVGSPSLNKTCQILATTGGSHHLFNESLLYKIIKVQHLPHLHDHIDVQNFNTKIRVDKSSDINNMGLKPLKYVVTPGNISPNLTRCGSTAIKCFLLNHCLKSQKHFSQGIRYISLTERLLAPYTCSRSIAYPNPLG